jgi:methionyl-tRNA formyltransferase
MNSKLKIIFLGTPDYLDPVIQSLDENFDLIKTIRSPKESLEEIKDLQPDLLVVASFGKIIPAEILEIPKLGAINIHPSLLPKYRGPSPIQSQILDGVTDSAISFILIDKEMDHGPIIYQEPYQIKPADTFESLLHSMFDASAALLPTIIRSFADRKLKPITQNDSEATFCQEIKKEDGYFDIENPPDTQILDRMIRAYYPWPTTWTKWNGKIVKLLPEGRIQMEGKKAVTINEFLNGYPNFPLKDLW